MSGPSEVTEIIAKEVSNIISQEPTNMEPTNVNADYILEFFTHLGTTISYYLILLYISFGSLFQGVSSYLYTLIYGCIEIWFLHGPRWWWLYVLKGNGGIPQKDICASMIGTNSNSFEGPGLPVCQEYIHHIINERAIFVSVLLICCYIKYGLVPTWNFFHSLYNHQDFLDKKKKRELANEKSLCTKKRNEEINACFRAIAAILSDDDKDFVSQINSVRKILNNIKNNDVLELINWTPVLDKQWESQKLSKNHKIIRTIGDGS